MFSADYLTLYWSVGITLAISATGAIGIFYQQKSYNDLIKRELVILSTKIAELESQLKSTMSQGQNNHDGLIRMDESLKYIRESLQRIEANLIRVN